MSAKFRADGRPPGAAMETGACRGASICTGRVDSRSTSVRTGTSGG